MKPKNIKDIIKILPFSKENKEMLLSNWETMDAGRRYEIGDIIWDYYDCLCEMRYQNNLQQAMIEVKQGNGKLDDDLYKSVREKSEKEIDEEMVKSLTSKEIEDIRSKLLTLMQTQTSPVKSS